MSGLDIATVAMLLVLAIAVGATLRGDTEARLVGSQLVAVVGIQIMLLRSIGEGVSYYADVAILFAFMAVVGGVLLARFLERWL